MEQIKVLIDEQTLSNKVKELVSKINNDFLGQDLTFVCILKGSVLFLVDLAKQIKANVELEFMKVSSYGENLISSGNIRIDLDIMNGLEGKNVIIIEDIIDTGRTLSTLIEHIKAKKPKTLKICTLLDKVERREIDIKVDYVRI